MFGFSRRPAAPASLDDAQLGVLARVVNSTTTRLFSTLTAFGISHNGARDINKVFGYPTDGERTFDLFWTYYKYHDYGSRVVTALPRSCWRDGACLREDEDSDEDLIPDEMSALDRAGLFLALERADILNRIGQFSVLYVGVPDGVSPKEPIARARGGKLEDVYFSPFAETSVQVSAYEMDVQSPRYGKPKLYTLTPQAVDTKGTSSLTDVRQPITVHWSRVVHLAEGALTNDLFGTPALDPVLNRLIDLSKAIGGSSEAFFRNASQKFTMDVDKDAQISETELAALDTAAKDWLNGWKTFIGARGSKFRTHPVSIASPEDSVKVALQAISGQTGIPMRILTGEGAGQLAGNEDKASYNQLISDRQKQQCQPWLLGALAPIAEAGLLKMPERFIVSWPLPEAMDEKTRSEVELNEAKTAEATARAIAAYASAPGASTYVPPDVFASEVLRMDVGELGSRLSELRALGDGGDSTEE